MMSLMSYSRGGAKARRSAGPDTLRRSTTEWGAPDRGTVMGPAVARRTSAGATHMVTMGFLVSVGPTQSPRV